MKIIKNNLVKNIAVSALYLVSLTVSAGSIDPLDSLTKVKVPFPAINLGVPTYVNPTYVDNSPVGFSGTWSSPAATPWLGTFTGTGTLALGASASATGTGVFDFSGLTNNGGLLPAHSYFTIADLDFGSATSETISLRAYDAAGDLLTDPWLEKPDWIFGNGPLVPSALPSYIWDAGAGTYTFDGAGETYAGNPNVAFSMLNTVPISVLEETKLTAYASFSIKAPTVVPVPAAVWLFGSGLLGLAGFARRR